MNKKPECVLVGTDGNVFSIIGRVMRALQRAGMSEKADEFQTRATECKSYDEVLILLHEYVDAI